MSRASSRRTALTLALALLAGMFGFAAPASAQSSSETGIIQITVKDAAKNEPLANARVFLLGPTVASALTTKSGIVKYTDVPSGIYRVRVGKAGYTGVTSSPFEVLGQKQVAVDVDLGTQRPATASNIRSGTLCGSIPSSTSMNVPSCVSVSSQDAHRRHCCPSLRTIVILSLSA